MDDRDEFVRSRVRDRLIQWGEDALPFLEIIANDEASTRRLIAREIIQAILPRRLENKFRRLAASAREGDIDLESGVLLLMEFGYPQADPQEVRSTLDRLAEDCSHRVSPKDSPPAAAEALSRFLFHEKGFAGNTTNFLDPDNSYFNRVLRRKIGIPITLSALCLFVAKRLELPIVGVGLPGHYIVKYDSLAHPVYFDPYHKGRVLTREDCVRRVTSLGHRFEEHHLSQSTHRETLVRMMNNLIMIYKQDRKTEKSRQLSEFVHILLDAPRNFTAQST